MGRILRVDDRGRVVIPSDVRERLGIKRYVRMYARDGKVILEPVRDAFEEVSSLVVEVRVKASLEPSVLSRVASLQLIKEARGASDAAPRDGRPDSGHRP